MTMKFCDLGRDVGESCSGRVGVKSVTREKAREILKGLEGQDKEL